MHSTAYRTIGPERPLGDREGAAEQWTPERVREISNEEVRNPADDEAEGPDDPDEADRTDS